MKGDGGHTAFNFVGSVPASKSLLNRALIVKSFFPELQIRGDSQADDVQLMKKALAQFGTFAPLDCGHAGTVLRFLALRASRLRGLHTLQGSSRLMSRPQAELSKILLQLGMDVNSDLTKLTIRSWGWKMMGDGLYFRSNESSQFASAVLLSAWDLDFPLHIHFGAQMASRSYFDMTVKLLRNLGMQIQMGEGECSVPKHQRLLQTIIDIEPDMSSAFAVAALAVVGGRAIIKNMPTLSLQPDAQFVMILNKMGVVTELREDCLHVQRAHELKPIDVSVADTPDLFPVLAVLCSLANGRSHLFGAPHLKFKESNRIVKIAELLRQLGREIEILNDGLIILGRPERNCNIFDFDSDQDHRLVMAAAVAQHAGFPVRLRRPEVVKKSFPEFLSFIETRA